MPHAIDIRRLDGVKALLAGLSEELREADRLAQNKMAYLLVDAEKDQMRKDIDRQTPWTVGALRYKKADAASALCEWLDTNKRNTGETVEVVRGRGVAVGP